MKTCNAFILSCIMSVSFSPSFNLMVYFFSPAIYSLFLALQACLNYSEFGNYIQNTTQVRVWDLSATPLPPGLT